jgi:drug/metabolite transporter (DMT)-like permease
MTEVRSSAVKATSPVLAGNAICFGAMALFALSFPLAEGLLDVWGPLALIGVRNALGVTAIFIAWRLIERQVAVAGLPWLRGGLIGGAGFGIGSTLLLVTQSMTDAVTTALVVAAMPLAAVALEVVLDGRRLTAWFIAGLILVLVGGAMATGESLSQAQVGSGLVLGMVSTVFYSWGSRATVKNLLGYSALTQTMLTTTGMAVFSLLALGLGWLMGWDVARMQGLDGAQITALGAYAFLALAVSQVMWVSAVGRIGVGLASFHLNAVPFYVMVILVIMGGSWNPQQVVGAAIVAAGVVLSQSGRLMND